MNRTYVAPSGLAEPPEPYAHGVAVGDLLFVAGQVAFDEDNVVVGVGDPEAQARQVWANITAVVEAAGGRIRDVVKITVFLADIRHAQAEIAARREHFEVGRFPICTMVQVANLGLPDLLMEVDAIAVLPRAGAGS
jgi:enamine deaminase RidA (YjgF/YER057c/UK114 family)